MGKSPRRRYETALRSYEVVDQIGQGGSGRVFKVVSEDKSVFAIKVFDPSLRSKSRLKRFRNELDFCRKASHTNIVRVLDHGLEGEDSSPFFVMPFYPATLRTILNASVPPEQALEYFAQILGGVESAHDAGIWHRDLKPENLLVDPESQTLVVSDFGIAHFQEESLLTAVETRAEERLANFLYAAPEQRLRGRPVDQRADIFALGLILNELFTGSVPHGTGYQSIASRASHFGHLDALVEAMIRQSPDDRPQTIADVRSELAAEKLTTTSARGLDTSGIGMGDSLRRNEEEIEFLSELADVLLEVLVYADEFEERQLSPFFEEMQENFDSLKTDLRKLASRDEAEKLEAVRELLQLAEHLNEFARHRRTFGDLNELSEQAELAAKEAARLRERLIDTADISEASQADLRRDLRRACRRLKEFANRAYRYKKEPPHAEEATEFLVEVSTLGFQLFRLSFLELDWPTKEIASDLRAIGRPLHLAEVKGRLESYPYGDLLLKIAQMYRPFADAVERADFERGQAPPEREPATAGREVQVSGKALKFRGPQGQAIYWRVDQMTDGGLNVLFWTDVWPTTICFGVGLPTAVDDAVAFDARGSAVRPKLYNESRFIHLKTSGHGYEPDQSLRLEIYGEGLSAANASWAPDPPG